MTTSTSRCSNAMWPKRILVSLYNTVRDRTKQRSCRPSTWIWCNLGFSLSKDRDLMVKTPLLLHLMPLMPSKIEPIRSNTRSKESNRARDSTRTWSTTITTNPCSLPTSTTSWQSHQVVSSQIPLSKWWPQISMAKMLLSRATSTNYWQNSARTVSVIAKVCRCNHRLLTTRAGREVASIPTISTNSTPINKAITKATTKAIISNRIIEATKERWVTDLRRMGCQI